MMNVSSAPATEKRTRWAKWVGYTACAWALLFALVHLYWGIEVSTGRLTVPGGAIAAGGRVDGSAWVAYAGILCILGVLVALLRFRGERMTHRMRLGVVGAACAAMVAYVIYAFTANGFQWLIAPGVLFVAGAVIALALIQPWGRAITRPLLLFLAWVGGTILILKTLYGALIQALAVIGVITWQQVQTLIGAPVSQAPTAQEGAHMTLWNFLVWNPWFLLGGLLFCVLAWLARRDLPEKRSWDYYRRNLSKEGSEVTRRTRDTPGKSPRASHLWGSTSVAFESTETSARGPIRRSVLVVLAALLGIVAGIGALIGAVATITDRPPLFLLAGLLAFCAVYLLGLLLVTRKIGPDRRRVRAVWFCLGSSIVAGTFAFTALLPMGDPQLPPAPVEGQRFWKLPTGSRIAYVRVAAEGDARQTPVIFLHGGPGVPDMKGDSEYFGRLAKDGFDVYVYDEVGTGRSSRLDDPRSYTLERDVSDLKEIRQKIGAERVVLIGHSYGGTIAAAYAASHPEHVARMVLSSPGDPSPSAGGASMLFRLDLRQKLGVYALLLPPRPMLAYTLLQVNPEAAHAFAGDREMDARQDRVYNRTRPALHCGDKPQGPKLHGLGFYANQYPQSAAREPHADFLPDLKARSIPTLIIKGRCDYLSWSSARDYLGALPDARLLYLDGSGHNAYQDEPERYMAAVRAFLLGRSLPERPYEEHRVPADYEGPP